MPDPTERIVNLALFLAASRAPVTAERIRAEVYGYPGEQDEAAFLRMFERDKDELRAAGLFVTSAPDGTYLLDASRSFCAEFELSAAEELTLRAAGSALLEDASFPYAEDLRRALVKISSATDSPVPVSSRIADERPGHQGVSVGVLTSASASGKRTAFGYTNSVDEHREHLVEGYGLFLREGRWYFVGRDTAIDEVRVYAVSRMREIAVVTARPKTPDFAIPEGFDVGTFIGLPFQYGSGTPFDATLRFRADVSWRASTLSADIGHLEPEGDALVWTVSVRDEDALLRWVLRNGPGIEIVEPAHLTNRMRELLEGVVSLYG